MRTKKKLKKRHLQRLKLLNLLKRRNQRRNKRRQRVKKKLPRRKEAKKDLKESQLKSLSKTSSEKPCRIQIPNTSESCSL